jgi:hypothetical protein
MGDVKHGWDRCMCYVDHPYHPSDMQGELYILSAEEQFLSTHCRCHSVLLHTGSHKHHLHHQQLHVPSSSYPRKSKLNLFLGYYYATFPIRSLGFLEFFSNPPLSIFGYLSCGPASHLAIMRTI